VRSGVLYRFRVLAEDEDGIGSLAAVVYIIYEMGLYRVMVAYKYRYRHNY
jgi:hypothetical protein